MSENIYDDPSNADVPWHVRHDDEIWADGGTPIGTWIADCGSALDAQRIVTLHNIALQGEIDERNASGGLWVA